NSAMSKSKRPYQPASPRTFDAVKISVARSPLSSLRRNSPPAPNTGTPRRSSSGEGNTSQSTRFIARGVENHESPSQNTIGVAANRAGLRFNARWMTRNWPTRVVMTDWPDMAFSPAAHAASSEGGNDVQDANSDRQQERRHCDHPRSNTHVPARQEPVRGPRTGHRSQQDGRRTRSCAGRVVNSISANPDSRTQVGNGMVGLMLQPLSKQ